MKKSFTTLLAVLVTLCTTSTALAKTPVPSSNEGVRIAVPAVPRMYYSVLRGGVIAPSFVKEPQNKAVNRGEKIVVLLEFTGEPLPALLVSKNGNPVDFSGSRIDIFSDSKGRAFMEIHEAEPEDTGDYTFRVINAAGSVDSSIKVCVK